MQFNSSLNKQDSILALTQATKEQKVSRALVVRDSNVSRWCLRASRGLGKKRKKKVVDTPQMYQIFQTLLLLFWLVLHSLQLFGAEAAEQEFSSEKWTSSC